MKADVKLKVGRASSSLIPIITCHKPGNIGH